MTSPTTGPGHAQGRSCGFPSIWPFPTVLIGLVALLLALVYMGGILNPNGNLRRLPIGLVNADQGAVVAGQPTEPGRADHRRHPRRLAAPDRSWRSLDEAAAMDELASGKLYGVLRVDRGLHRRRAALDTSRMPNPARPTMTVLTNPGAGSLASSLASSISQAAAHTGLAADSARQLTAGLPGRRRPRATPNGCSWPTR